MALVRRDRLRPACFPIRPRPTRGAAGPTPPGGAVASCAPLSCGTRVPVPRPVGRRRLQGRGGRRVFSLGYEGSSGKCSGSHAGTGWMERSRPSDAATAVSRLGSLARSAGAGHAAPFANGLLFSFGFANRISRPFQMFRKRKCFADAPSDSPGFYSVCQQVLARAPTRRIGESRSCVCDQAKVGVYYMTRDRKPATFYYRFRVPFHLPFFQKQTMSNKVVKSIVWWKSFAKLV